MPANITINEAPKEPKEDSSAFKGFSKAESDSITTVALGLGALVGGYFALNYLDGQGIITDILEKIGINGGNGNGASGTVPEGTPPTSGAADAADVAYSYAVRQEQQYQEPVRGDFAKYSPDLSDISGDVEYKLHGDDSNLGAVEDPDDQYYYENADFSPGRSAAYTATLEHDPRSDIAESYLGQEDGILTSYVGEGTGIDAEEVGSYLSEELVPSDLSKYRVERDNLGNLLDVSVDH